MHLLNRFYTFILLLAVCSCNEKITSFGISDKLPEIYPDYIGVTIPKNICPLDFGFAGDEYDKINVVFKADNSQTLEVEGDEYIDIDVDKWHSLLSSANKLTVSVFGKNDNGWYKFKDFEIDIDSDEIDYGLTYRKIAPSYGIYSTIGMYERDLSNFDEHVMIDGNQLQYTCMNCHTANRCNPDQFLMHIRGDHGGTFIKNNNQMKLYNTRTSKTFGNFQYSYWHPSGKYVVCSINSTHQGFFTLPGHKVTVMDSRSDLVVYDVEKERVILMPELMTRDFENFPAFSADGKKIYFSKCDSVAPDQTYKKLKYNILSIDFDAASATTTGKIDTLINAKAIEKSAAQPRPSYDGKFILYSLAESCDFTIWHQDADLWIYNLESKQSKPLTQANSQRAESFHNWSSNSKWIVFVSRRDDGNYSRLYISHIDENGDASKAFMLPQRNPKEFYTQLTESYNTPDFTVKSVKFDSELAVKQALSDFRNSVK